MSGMIQMLNIKANRLVQLGLYVGASMLPCRLVLARPVAWRENSSVHTALNYIRIRTTVSRRPIKGSCAMKCYSVAVKCRNISSIFPNLFIVSQAAFALGRHPTAGHVNNFEVWIGHCALHNILNILAVADAFPFGLISL